MKAMGFKDTDGLNWVVEVGECRKVHFGRSMKVHYVQFKGFSEKITTLKPVGRMKIGYQRHEQITIIE